MNTYKFVKLNDGKESIFFALSFADALEYFYNGKDQSYSIWETENPEATLVLNSFAGAVYVMEDNTGSFWVVIDENLEQKHRDMLYAVLSDRFLTNKNERIKA